LRSCSTFCGHIFGTTDEPCGTIPKDQYEKLTVHYYNRTVYVPALAVRTITFDIRALKLGYLSLAPTLVYSGRTVKKATTPSILVRCTPNGVCEDSEDFCSCIAATAMCSHASNKDIDGKGAITVAASNAELDCSDSSIIGYGAGAVVLSSSGNNIRAHHVHIDINDTAYRVIAVFNDRRMIVILLYAPFRRLRWLYSCPVLPATSWIDLAITSLPQTS
jgi:hypothetical protein